MSPAETLVAAADLIRDLAAQATEGPWHAYDTEDTWSLHGVMARLPAAGGVPEQVVTKQILKAPKHGTPYAEYWPDDPDARWIAALSPDKASLIETMLRVAAVEEASPSPLEYGSASLNSFMTIAREWARSILSSGVDTP